MMAMDFKSEWFVSEKNWFSKNPIFDKYITEKWGYLLDTSNEGLDFVTQILIYDQLPRHVYRNEASSHVVEYFLQKALAVVSDNINSISKLSNNEWVFAVLPIRHFKDRNGILKLIQLAWNRMSVMSPHYNFSKNGVQNTLLKKFLRASYTQLGGHTPLRRSHEVNEPLITGAPVSNVNLDNFITILEEVEPIDERYDDERYQTKASIKVGIRNLVVSLSGGVDSMVALNLLRKQTNVNVNIIAVHINYCNRDTSYFEAEFVNWWCNKIGVKLYTRHITEFTRKQAVIHGLRDIYEKYTKNIRFNSYATAAKLSGFNEFQVVLGHNKDDTFENILTNITAQSKWENLLGMELHGTINCVHVFRPLINTSKAEIRSYARKYNIPNLYDSTTDVCQRGKIRTNIVPVLNKWNPDCINGMYVMSDIMKDLYANNKVLVRLFLNEFQKGECNLIDLSESVIFWREFFNVITPTTRLCRESRPSNKSLLNYINKINVIKKSWSNSPPDKNTLSVVLTSSVVIEFSYISSIRIGVRICTRV
jgi:tRNA(Ile)-lysidine synthetase-like protein